MAAPTHVLSPSEGLGRRLLHEIEAQEESLEDVRLLSIYIILSSRSYRKSHEYNTSNLSFSLTPAAPSCLP
jgi:hypothetical protein